MIAPKIPDSNLYKKISLAASAIAIFVGSCVLLGWVFDIALLKSSLYGTVTMKANTALCCLLLGITLRLGHHRRFNNLRKAIALFVVSIGFLTILQYCFGWDFGIDRLIAYEANAINKVHPGRMGINTALNFVLLGSALFFNRKQQQYTQILSLLAALVAFQTLVGHLYGARILSRIVPYSTKMSFLTALTFLVLCVGILCLYPRFGLIEIIASDRFGGVLARRLLPTAIVVPLGIGYLILQGQKAGFFDFAFGISVFVLIVIVILAIVIWQSVQQLERLDRERSQLLENERSASHATRTAQQQVTAIFESITDAFIAVDRNWRYTYLNHKAEELLGKTRSELIGKNIWDVVPSPPDSPSYILGYKAMEERVSVQYEEHFPTLGIWLTVRVYPSQDGIVVYFQDITEHKHTEAALRASEEKLRSFVESDVIGILFSDVNGGISKANDEFLRIIGYSREELEAGEIRWIDLTPPEYLYLDELGIAEAQSRGACTPYEKAYIRKNGNHVSVLIGYSLTGEERLEAVAFILDLTQSKQAQAEILRLNQNLEQRVNELQILLDVIPVGIGIAKDAACSRIEFNSVYREMLGVSAEKTMSESGEKSNQFYQKGRLLAPKDLPIHVAATGKTVRDAEIEIVLEDGKTIALLCNASPLLDEQGRPRGSIGVFLDISEQQAALRERQRIEVALRQSEERYRTLVDSVPQAMWVQNPEGNITFFNQKWLDYTGITEKGEDWLQGIHQSDRSKFLQARKQAMTAKVPYECEIRLRRADGSDRWHLSRVVPLMQDGQILAWFGTATDIDDLKETELVQRLFAEASILLASSLDYETTLKNVARLAVPTLADCCFLDLVDGEDWERVAWAHSNPVQQAAIDRLNQPLPQKYPDYPHARTLSTGMPELISVTEEWIQEVATNPQQRQLMEIQLRSLMVVPLVVGEGRKGALTFCFTAESDRHYTRNDLAVAEALAQRAAVAIDRALTYRDAQEVNRMKDEFIAVVSHELRSPLNAILGWAKLLRSRTFDAATTDKALETIERNAKSQAQLIEDLLDISRMIRGAVHLEVCSINLISVIESAIETVHLAAEAKGIEVKFEYDPEIGRLSGDVNRLKQILWNLLSNAVKFTPKGGQVVVKLTEEREKFPNIDEFAQIQVIDTGIGIPGEFLPFLFDRFRQADSSRTRSQGGLGLGLSIVRHLVELHGGTIKAESSGISQGATLTVKLPLLSPNRHVPYSVGIKDTSPSLTDAEALDRLRVLLVDDEADGRDFVTTVLEEYGAIVTTAASVIEALQRLEQFEADILISDIGMPNEDGYSLIQRLRQQGKNIRAIALTAFAREEDRDRAIAAGFQLHLAKPVEPDILVQAIARLINN